jgi:branched-chain amino acid transport system permease protein
VTDPIYLLIQLVNGLQYGLLLFLMASGLSLMLGAMGILNLAHGAIYMLGAYLGFGLVSLTGRLEWALVLIIPVSLGIGLVIERVLLRKTFDQHPLEQVLLTFGLVLILEEIRSLVWGDDVLSITVPTWLSGSLPLTDLLTYPHYRIAVGLLCLLIAVGLFVFIHRTRFGLQILALSENRRRLASLGINPAGLSAAVVAVGCCLAMLAGLLAAPIYTLYPQMGQQVLVTSLVVVILGGLGSLTGTLLAALVIGLMDTFGRLVFPQASGLAIYLCMAAMLAFRPQGLMGLQSGAGGDR